jgi:hypothetical protein
MEVKVKKILIVSLILIICGSAFTIDLLSYPPPVKGNDFLIDIGVGFTNAGEILRIPPLGVKLEYALPVKAPISIGGLAAFYRTGTKDETWTYLSFGGRGNWHWAFPVKWLDFYTGFFLGYKYANWDGASFVSAANKSGLAYGAQVGAHFYFGKTLGIMVEFGYPFLVRAGFALKF